VNQAFRCRLSVILTVGMMALPCGADFALPRKGKIPPALAEILSHMNDAAKRLKTISASLEYTKVTVLVDDKSTETGQLLFRKGKNADILIDIKKPDAKTILFRKNRAEIFNPRINQIQEYDLEEKSSLVEQFFLLGFGTDADRLKKDYDLKFLREEDFDGDTTVVLELTPRSEETRAQITTVMLWVSEESWLPVQQKFLQPGGDYFIARYTNVKVNRAIPSSAFQISAPDAKRVKMN
jgi:outer membrane lipoprotein-sorting protein